MSPKESKRRKVEADKKQKTEDRERKKAEHHNEKQLHKAIHKVIKTRLISVLLIF